MIKERKISMKNITRITAGLLAIIMILALATTAFAEAPTFTIKTPTTDTHTYNVYQIFKGDFYGDVNGDKLSNIELGDNAKPGIDKAAALTALTGLAADATDAAKLAVITQYVNMESDPIQVYNGHPATVPAGYYLIKDAVPSDSGDDPNTVYIVEVADNIVITRKAEPANLDKVIVEGEAEKTVNSANIGDTVSFKLTATLPEQYNDYSTFYLSFQDTLSAGLTLDASSIVVKHGTTPLTDEYFIYGNQNAFQVVIYNLKTAVQSAQPGDTIVLTYNATVNKDAVITKDGNTNEAKLVYTVNPSVTTDPTPADPGTPGTPDKPEIPNDTPPSDPTGTGPTTTETTKTVVFGLQINKTDGKDPLTGAEFTLTPAATYAINKVIVTGTRFEEISDDATLPASTAVYWKLKDNKGYTTVDPTDLSDAAKELYENPTKTYQQVAYTDTDQHVIEAADDQEVKAFVDAGGVAKFSGLKAGTYTLTETKTPDGYNTAAPITITFTVNADGTVSATQVTGTTTTELSRVSATEPSFSLDVINVAGVILPTTGGMGTTIFYVLGAVMVFGAGVLLITKKRMGM